jgi:CheY-like chemotaxis protein
MSVLIVEDNAFNAFCIKRLFAFINNELDLTIVPDSFSALSYLAENNPALVILDGDLSTSDGCYCNGPVLAELILRTNPQLPIIAWSNSEPMRAAFAEVFRQHNRLLNDYNCWPKIVSVERINNSLSFLLNLNPTVEAAGIWPCLNLRQL